MNSDKIRYRECSTIPPLILMLGMRDQCPFFSSRLYIYNLPFHGIYFLNEPLLTFDIYFEESCSEEKKNSFWCVAQKWCAVGRETKIFFYVALRQNVIFLHNFLAKWIMNGHRQYHMTRILILNKSWRNIRYSADLISTFDPVQYKI